MVKMSKLVITLTVLAVALCASGFKLESVFPVATYPNMYYEPPYTESSCKDAYFSMGGCQSCKGGCSVKNGDYVPVSLYCNPSTVIDELIVESALKYYVGLIPVTMPNKTTVPVNCAPYEKCTLLDSNDVFGPGAPAGKYYFSSHMKTLDGKTFLHLGDCECDVYG